MLLVDHDEAEVGELDVLLEQGVGADDDAGLPGDHPRAWRRPRRLGHRAGEQRDRRRLVGTAEHAAAGQVAEQPVMDRWCCWASTSVGASSAAWPPESTTRSIARSATTVLPEPTSPWSRRCIGWGCARSASISAPISAVPSVRTNGSPLVERGQQTAAAVTRACAQGAQERRRRPRTTWVTSASSRTGAAAADLDLGEGVRRVDQVDGGARVDDVVLVADLPRDDLGHLVDHVERAKLTAR